MKNLLTRGVMLMVLNFLLFLIVEGQDRPKVLVPEEMFKLHFLLGDWDYNVKTYNKAGEVIKEANYLMTYSTEFNGMLVTATSGYLKNGKFSKGQQKWLFFDRLEQVYKQVNFDVVGNFNTYVGAFRGDELVIQYPEPVMGPDNVSRIWRKTYKDIRIGKFKVIYDYSEDEGQTWTIQWYQAYIKKSAKPLESVNQKG